LVVKNQSEEENKKANQLDFEDYKGLTGLPLLTVSYTSFPENPYCHQRFPH